MNSAGPPEAPRPPTTRQEMGRVPSSEFLAPKRKVNGAGVQVDQTHICVVMVGLPARGKSLIAQKGISTSIYAERMACSLMLSLPSDSCTLPWLALNRSTPLQCGRISSYQHAYAYC